MYCMLICLFVPKSKFYVSSHVILTSKHRSRAAVLTTQVCNAVCHCLLELYGFGKHQIIDLCG